MARRQVRFAFQAVPWISFLSSRATTAGSMCWCVRILAATACGERGVAAGDVALLRVTLASFSDGSAIVAPSDYLSLPKVEGYDFQNRFVDHYLLYGSGSGWGYPKNTARSPLFLVRWSDGANYQLTLSHGADRIEQMGRDAVVVGTDGKNLHFTSVRLGD